MMDWKIYYTDSEFSSDDGSWFEAPARGVIAVTAASDLTGREIMQGTNFYVWWPGATYPWSIDDAGLWDFLYEVKSPRAGQPLQNEHFDELASLGVKFGRSMDTNKYRARLLEIENDPDFPPQSAAPPGATR
jgi:hypothetical protein